MPLFHGRSVRRQRAFSLLMKAIETGWLLRRSPQTPLSLMATKMAMETADDGDEIHPVLNLVGILRCSLFGFVGPIGDGSWT